MMMYISLYPEKPARLRVTVSVISDRLRTFILYGSEISSLLYAGA